MVAFLHLVQVLLSSKSCQHRHILQCLLTLRCAGIKACSCVEGPRAKARAEGVKDSKLEKMRPACATSCHRFRLKGAWAMRVNRGGKVVDKSKVNGKESAISVCAREHAARQHLQHARCQALLSIA